MLETATDAQHVPMDWLPILIKEPATDPDQPVPALRDSQLMDSDARTAVLTKWDLQLMRNNVFKHLNVLETMRSMETPETAISVLHATMVWFLIETEEHASDHDQFAVAHRDTHLMDIHAFHAELTKLDQLQMKNNVFQLVNAQEETKSGELNLIVMHATHVV